ncbi:hypothetical protein CK203_115006 [Vitis vinifera]|uniref:Uncharacterized protein n=1 Tax=Vitis vinifera TaxID=29760 RepID=A0A438CYZ8_VITVI|nr:hypothetical protein CK203_115006 [Vitis vinifera]
MEKSSDGGLELLQKFSNFSIDLQGSFRYQVLNPVKAKSCTKPQVAMKLKSCQGLVCQGPSHIKAKLAKSQVKTKLKSSQVSKVIDGFNHPVPAALHVEHECFLHQQLEKDLIGAFHHYRGVDNQRPAPKKHPELDQLLKEKYRGLDDFHRAKEKVPSTKEDSH